MTKIRIYSTATCPYCHALMDWLDGQNIKYEEIDAENMEDIDIVPLTVIGNTKITGFDRPAIKKALKANGII